MMIYALGNYQTEPSLGKERDDFELSLIQALQRQIPPTHPPPKRNLRGRLALPNRCAPSRHLPRCALNQLYRLG